MLSLSLYTLSLTHRYNIVNTKYKKTQTHGGGLWINIPTHTDRLTGRDGRTGCIDNLTSLWMYRHEHANDFLTMTNPSLVSESKGK